MLVMMKPGIAQAIRQKEPCCRVTEQRGDTDGHKVSKNDKKERSDHALIGIAEGGARTHDLEVDLLN